MSLIYGERSTGKSVNLHFRQNRKRERLVLHNIWRFCLQSVTVHDPPPLDRIAILLSDVEVHWLPHEDVFHINIYCGKVEPVITETKCRVSTVVRFIQRLIGNRGLRGVKIISGLILPQGYRRIVPNRLPARPRLHLLHLTTEACRNRSRTYTEWHSDLQA